MRVRDFQKVDPHLRSHPAFKKFVRTLGADPNLANGILSGLWAFAFDFAHDGNLSRFSAEDLALSLDWQLDADQVMSALEGTFLIEGRLKDWSEWGGAVFEERAYEAGRKWDQRQKKAEPLSQGHPGTTGDCPTRREETRPYTPPIVPPKENKAVLLFEETFWPRYPNRHGSKKLAKSRFTAASTAEQTRIVAAEANLLVAIETGAYDTEYLPRAENFVGGRKTYYEEWADGVPAKYRGDNGRRKPECENCGTTMNFNEKGDLVCPMCR